MAQGQINQGQETSVSVTLSCLARSFLGTVERTICTGKIRAHASMTFYYDKRVEIGHICFSKLNGVGSFFLLSTPDTLKEWPTRQEK